MMLSKALTLKFIVVSVLVAYLSQIILSYFFISSENILEDEIILVQDSEISNRLLKSKFDEENIPTFKDKCEIRSSDALSAIKRAKTQYCKNKIADIVCLIQEGNYYPESLPNSCPNNGLTYGKYLGCYKDKFKPRILSGFDDNSKNNTRKRCLDLCVLGGFPYAGVQYGAECFCGNHRPPKSALLEESACNMTCSGAPDETCGGPLAINVFETGVAKFTAVIPKAPSNSNGQVKIVFLLTLSGRKVRQVHRLINALYRSHHYYYIHVDLRHEYLYRNLLPLEQKFPNIKLVKQRFATVWAGITFWRMLLSSMKDLIDLGWRWDFVTNLSESDFPIKPIEDLENFLSANKNLNFVGGSTSNFKRYIYKQGLDKTFIECEERMWLVGERDLPKGIVVDGASDWMTLSREFVSYVVGETDELLTGFDTIFKYTIFPPESYFHMVMRNSRFCNNYVNNDLHYTNWKGDRGCQCHKKVIDWCGCSPVDFRGDYIGILKNTTNRFFARKFEAIINQDIINKIEDHIGIQDHDEIDTLNSYWENIYNYEDNASYSKNDELLLSHAKSITRISAKNYKQEGCYVEPGSINDVNLYKYADVYWGNLILYNAVFDNKEVVLETWYKPIPRAIERDPNSELAKRLKIFDVGSDYDKKEMVFRNFATILGPYSELDLLYEFNTHVKNKTESFNIKWVDPSGHLSYTHKILVNEEKLRDFIKPILKLPLKPGVWTAKLYDDKDFILSKNFLIIPLETEEKDAETIPNNLKLVDELNTQFYSLIHTCISKSSISQEPVKCGSKIINTCESTHWSSLYPDPKGFLGTLNKTTGKLDRI